MVYYKAMNGSECYGVQTSRELIQKIVDMHHFNNAGRKGGTAAQKMTLTIVEVEGEYPKDKGGA